MAFPIPESAYLHIPFCRRRCFYCDFPISVVGNGADLAGRKFIEDYVEALYQEIRATKPENSKPLKTVFFGGGTPSLLPVENLAQILKALDQQFGIDKNAEISIEVDPGTFMLDQLRAYQDLGVNRFSLGVQAFQDELLTRCGRSHNVNDIYSAIALFRQAGINNFSLDLISGLPEQSLTQWQESLEKAIALQPNHLSCYDLVLEPVTVFGKRYESGEAPLPNDELTADMYRLAQSLLTTAGYDHYEISNYAQAGYQCQHNRVYWKNQAYYGFGMGAASYTNGQRFTRPRTRESYYAWVQNYANDEGILDCPVTSKTDQFLETLMLGLRLAEGVQLSQLGVNTATIEQLLDVLRPYIQQQWVKGFINHNESVRVLDSKDWHKISAIALSDPEGFLFSNTVLTTLFQAFTSDLE